MINFTLRTAIYQAVNAANSSYRSGTLIDEQTPGQLNGSRIRAELAMQNVGVFESILAAGSGDDPDNVNETRLTSQVVENLITLILGRAMYGTVSGNATSISLTSLTPTPTPTLFDGMTVVFNNGTVTPTTNTNVAAFGNTPRPVRYRGGATGILPSDLQGLTRLTYNASGVYWELDYPPPPSAVGTVETFRQAITFTPSTTYAFAHGLSGEPQRYYVEATNVVADGGFQPGDKIELYPGATERNWYVYVRGGTIRAHSGSDGVGIFASTGNYSSFTPTNFTYELVAKYNPLDPD